MTAVLLVFKMKRDSKEKSGGSEKCLEADLMEEAKKEADKPLYLARYE